eukprot:CAMPEP_0184492322 /NCGR_PEP_ID=MMETSP0113_2-20130426/22865_1 /TAXON_ID=91329 /ORGANISM="Norrisiella sphaerica, Strain BC52" /LENGTH=1031 /DNA_ID=CAMNT_0026877047 /DNA_START=297 /DNA_END=3392 /DNA_ORIENTATION=+
MPRTSPGEIELDAELHSALAGLQNFAFSNGIPGHLSVDLKDGEWRNYKFTDYLRRHEETSVEASDEVLTGALREPLDNIKTWSNPLWTQGSVSVTYRPNGGIQVLLNTPARENAFRIEARVPAYSGKEDIIATVLISLKTKLKSRNRRGTRSGKTEGKDLFEDADTVMDSPHVTVQLGEEGEVEARSLVSSARWSRFPIKFRGGCLSWPCSKWSPAWLKDSPYSEIDSLVRFHPLSELSPEDNSTEIPWESQCDYARVSVGAFCEWLCASEQGGRKADESKKVGIPSSSSSQGIGAGQKRKRRQYEAGSGSGGAGNRIRTRGEDLGTPPLFTSSAELHAQFPPGRGGWWGYMDYKHFESFFRSDSERREAARATRFQEFQRQGQPTYSSSLPALWIGSEGAATKLHYDAFGYNLVAQIHGRKLWRLASACREHTARLHPTRIPFEESSIYSDSSSHLCGRQTSQTCSKEDLKGAEKEKGAFVETVLKPGDLLYMPRHCWHEVRALSPSVSVNQWCELMQDSKDRVQESIVKTLVHLLSDCRGRGSSKSNSTRRAPQLDPQLVSAWSRAFGRDIDWFNSNEFREPLDTVLRSTLIAATMHLEAQGEISESHANMTVHVPPDKVLYLLARALTHPGVVKHAASVFLHQLSCLGGRQNFAGSATRVANAASEHEVATSSANAYGNSEGSFSLLPVKAVGSFGYIDRNEAEYLYNEIFLRRSYEISHLDLDFNAADHERGINIVDVGANIGLFALYCQKRWPFSRLLCVEPIPEIFHVLSTNLKGFDNSVLCLQAGVSNKKSVATFRYYPEMPGESTMHPEERRRQQNVYRERVAAEIKLLQRNRDATMSGEGPGDSKQAGGAEANCDGNPRAEDDGEDGENSGSDEDSAVLLEAMRDIQAQTLSRKSDSGLERKCNVLTMSEVLREAQARNFLSPEDRIDWLKIDVEGEELESLEGIETADWLRIERVCVEVANVDEKRLAAVCNLLVRKGFRVFTGQTETSTEGGYLSFVPKELNLHMVYAKKIRSSLPQTSS